MLSQSEEAEEALWAASLRRARKMKHLIPDAVITYDVFGVSETRRIRDCKLEELAETIYLSP